MNFMNKNFYKTTKINGKGWNGLVIQQNNNEEIDLLNLVEKKPEKYPFFLESSSRGNVLNRYSIIFYKCLPYSLARLK